MYKKREVRLSDHTTGYFTEALGQKDQEALPAVVLLPPAAGLSKYTEAISLQLAQQGYHSFAIDYYSERGGAPDISDRAKAVAVVASLNDQKIVSSVKEAVNYLSEQPGVRTNAIAVLGFCVGGTYSLLSAALVDGLACAVAFYGPPKYAQLTPNKPTSPLTALADVKCPVLGHYGAEDGLIPLPDVNELQAVLVNKPAEIYTYPGAGHAYHEDFRPDVYRPVAAEESWRRTLRYLAWYCETVST